MQASDRIARAADTISFCRGLQGNALDLTDEVANRIPVILDKSQTPDYTQSFSFSIWIQTKPGARQSTPIMTNKKVYRPGLEVHREYRNICDEAEFYDQSKTPGLILGTTDLGGWYLHLCDSATWYSYNADCRTAAHQRRTMAQHSRKHRPRQQRDVAIFRRTQC